MISSHRSSGVASVFFAAALISTLLSIPGRSQEITVVDDTSSTTLTNGQLGVVDFGCTQVGTPVSMPFTIRNESLSDPLVLKADGLTLPAGYSLNPGWPRALITPEFKIVIQKDNAGASADDSTSIELVQVPSIISIDDISISVPDVLIDASNGPDSQTPYIDVSAGIAISQDPTKTTLDFDEVPGGGWICPTPGSQSNPNGDICAEFSGRNWVQGMETRWQASTLRFTRGVLTGTLDDPASNGSVFFGFGVAGLNPPRVPGSQNDGDGFGQGGIEVSMTIYNSDSDTTEVLTGVFQDDMIDNNRSEVTLFGTPVLIPIPISIPPAMTWLDVVGTPLTVQLDALADGIYPGTWSLENNDADENPFDFPITGLVDGTPPVITNLPMNIFEPSIGMACNAVASWTEPGVTDNLDVAPMIMQTGGLPSGSTFQVGVHTIEYTATDCAGNMTVETFEVSVTDTTPPTLVGSLPKRIIANTAPGDTSVVVDYPTLTANDDCDPNPTVVCTPPSGSVFPLGLTQVCCVAMDSSGNMSLQACFDVIVIEAQPTPSPRVLEGVSKRNDPVAGIKGATMLGVNHAFINESGSVAIEGTMLGAGSGNVAIWKDTGAGLELVSRKGDVAPGTGLGISSFDDVVLNDLGQMAFESRLSGATGATDAFHGNDTSGGLALSVREGDTAPASTATVSILHEPAFDGVGSSFSPANLVLGAGGVTVANDTGIWGKPLAGPLAQVAREGAPVGAALPGVNFGQVVSRVVANGGGEVAFYAFLEVSGGVTIADNAAIFSGDPASLTVVSREGDTAPGADPALFQTYAAESINSLGQVAFEAGLKTGGGGSTVSSTTNSGLYTNSNGPVELVAREGDLAPCLGGTAGNFSSFRDIFITENGDVYFHAFLAGGAINSANDGTFWRWRATDSTLHPILREGDPAPSTQGAVFARLTGFAVSNGGLQAVTATLVPGIGDCLLSNNYGLWMDDGTDGLPILKIREGDTTDLGLSTIPFITVTFIEKTTNFAGGNGGHGKVLNDAGELIIKTSFNLNTSGAFVLPAAP